MKNMAVIIECDNKIILKVRNAIFDMLYNNMLDNIESNNLILSNNIQSFINELCSACHGLGADVAQFLKTYDDAILFSNLIGEAIKKAEKIFPLSSIQQRQIYGIFIQNLSTMQKN